MLRSGPNILLAIAVGLVLLTQPEVGDPVSGYGLAGVAYRANRLSIDTRPQVRVLSAIGMRQVLLEIGPSFERATGLTFTVSFDSAGEIRERVDKGETADLLLLPRSTVDHLVGDNKILPGSVTDLAVSQVGVAVRKGKAWPDIATPEAFRRAMLEAKSIACPDPARGGSSGVHIAWTFEKLGISEQVRRKLVYSSTPGDAHAMPGHAVAAGRAEVALHQMQELLAVPGIEIVGPLPSELNASFVFSAGIHTAATQPQAAQALVEYLCTPHVKGVIKSKGMEPVAP